MGFIRNLIDGVKNVSSTVGKVASSLSGIPVIGGFASQVANIANLVNTGANIGSKIYDAVAPAAKEIGGHVKNVIDAGKSMYDSGKKAWDSGKKAWETGKSVYDTEKGRMRPGGMHRDPRIRGPPKAAPQAIATQGAAVRSGQLGGARTVVRG